MIKYDIVFHVGLPRTGSTFLQKEIFIKHPKLNFIKSQHIRKNRDFNWELSEIKSRLLADKINIVSDEIICRPKNRKKILKVFKNEFPNSKLIFAKRKKDEWKKSLYNKYIKSGGNVNYKKWEEELFIDINIDNYISHIKNLFDDFYIYDFKKFKESRKIFVNDLCNFLNIEVNDYNDIRHNKSLNNNYIEFFRVLNNFYKSPYNNSALGFIPYKYHYNKIISYIQNIK